MIRQRQGFTLLELLVCMAIMASVMAMILVGWHNMGRGARMRGAVTAVQSTLALARQRAIVRQTPLSVLFTNDANNVCSYQVQDPQSNRVGEVMHIPAGILVDSPNEVVFTPSGSAEFDTATITLTQVSGNPEEWELTIYGLTGLVRAEYIGP